MGPTSGILESETALVHLVLLRNAPWEEMDVTSLISLHLQCAGFKGPLFTDQDVEIIVCGVQSGVALRAKGGAKNNEVFRDGRVNDVHGTHGAPSVVKNPFGGVRVESDDTRRGGVGRREVRRDVLNHAIQIVGVCSNGIFRDLMEEWWVKNVPPVLKPVCIRFSTRRGGLP